MTCYRSHKKIIKEMKMKKNLFLLTVLVLILSSCASVHDYNYFQDTTAGDVNRILNASQAITIKPYDKINIFVSCKDPQLASIYNLMQVNNRMTGSNGRTIGSGSSAYGNGYSLPYTVDEVGEVEMPVLGKIHVAGLTRQQVSQKVKDKLVTSEQGVKDAIVTVEFAGLYVGVLGEVGSKGIVAIDRDQFTILDVLERSGDLTPDGNRRNIKVYRKSGDQVQTYELDITNMRDLLASPAYMMQQDDIVYVEPSKKKARQSTVMGNTWLTPAFWMSLFTFGVSVAALLK